MIKALIDANSDVRTAAAEALGKIRDPRAVVPLVAALDDDSWSVNKSVAEALEKLGPPAVESLIDVLYARDQ
ncbi:HEAT repeat domain-containing protein, partial [Escherichia coli]